MNGSAWEPWLDQARALHAQVPVFVGYFDFTSEQFAASGGVQSDLAKYGAAGVRNFAVSIGFGCYFQTGPREYELAGPDEWLLRRQLERIDFVLDTIRACPRARLITNASQLAAPPGDDTIGAILHLTGNNHTVDLATVDAFFARGVRATHPAIQYHNRWCSGHEGRPGPVLTGFGRQVVARMNELGIVLDTAHASDESARAIVEASSKPVVDGHTTSRDFVPSSRGLRDETLVAIADRGGVIGVHFADHMLSEEVWRRKYSGSERYKSPKVAPRIWSYNAFVLASTKDPDERMRLRRDRDAQERFFRDRGLPPEPAASTERVATLAHMADLVGYLVDLVGVEHVGLGGDVNGIANHQWPAGMDHVGELPHLTAELLRRGYAESSLRKFLSENWRRVYSECLPRK